MLSVKLQSIVMIENIGQAFILPLWNMSVNHDKYHLLPPLSLPFPFALLRPSLFRSTFFSSTLTPRSGPIFTGSVSLWTEQ